MTQNRTQNKLGDIIELKYGKGLPKRDRIVGKFPVYGSGGIVDFHNEFCVEGPGIVVGRKGTIGSLFYQKGNFFPIDTVFYIEDSEFYDLKFIYFLLSTLGLKKLNSDAAVPGLNRNVAYLQEVSLPLLPIQQKIANILSKYDDLIENNTRRIKILEEQAQLIYTEWFVKFKFPGHENVKMVDSGTEFGKIPEGCEVKRIGDLLQPIKRNPKVPKSEYLEKGNIPVIDQSRADIAGYINDYRYIQKEFLPMVVFGDHTRILKYINFPFASGADGTQLLYPSNEKLLPVYFYMALINVELKNELYTRHFKFLKEKVIIIPNDDKLEKYNTICEPMFSEILNLQKQNQNLKETRDMLIPKLVSGEILVN